MSTLKPPEFAFLACRADPSTIDGATTTAAEAMVVFAHLEQTLEARGFALSDLVKIRFFYTVRSDFPEMNTVRDPLFRKRFPGGDFPSSGGFVTGGRGGVRPQLELEVIAHRRKRAINAAGVLQEFAGLRLPMSHANIAGDVVFTSGTGPFDINGRLIDPDPVRQAAGTLEILVDVLAAAGCAAGDTFSLTIYLTPAAVLVRTQIVQVMETFLEASTNVDRPLLTVIPVRELGLPYMHVEIELYARAPPEHTALSTLQTRHAVGGTVRAIRHGGFFIASGEANGFDVVCADLRRALDGIDLQLADVDLLTVWFSPMEDRDRLDRLIRETVAPEIAVSLLPLAAGDRRSVLVEAFGSISQ